MSSRLRFILSVDGSLYTGSAAKDLFRKYAALRNHVMPAKFGWKEMREAASTVFPGVRVFFHVFREPRYISQQRSRYKTVAFERGIVGSRRRKPKKMREIPAIAHPAVEPMQVPAMNPLAETPPQVAWQFSLTNTLWEEQ